MKSKTILSQLLLYVILLTNFSSCIINDAIKDTSKPVNPGDDPNFTIVASTDPKFQQFHKKIMVFDISIYAFESVEDQELIHAANLLAQYLDNNEDGDVDNSMVYSQIMGNSSFIYLWKTTDERDSFSPLSGYNDFGIDSNVFMPSWHINHTGTFDNGLQFIWSFITENGYSVAYPSVFSSQSNSEISQAMDVARDGSFQTPPMSYSANAWYTNSDSTCDYTCQVTKYNYWVLTSILGAQENRLAEIESEWKLNTSAKVQSGDVKAWAIFSNSTYLLPTILPDGTYKH